MIVCWATGLEVKWRFVEIFNNYFVLSPLRLFENKNFNVHAGVKSNNVLVWFDTYMYKYNPVFEDI